MGGLAFALLMTAEFAIAAFVFVFGRSLADHLEHYQELHALLGFAAQTAFALFPVIQR